MKELLSPIIGFTGVIVGVLISSFFSYCQFNYQQETEKEKMIIQKRIDLIEKTSKLIGMNPGMIDLFNEYKKQVFGNKNYVQNSEKLLQYNAEYNSTILLVSMFFGKEVRNIIHSYSEKSGPYWEKLNNKLLEAMINEKLELTKKNFNWTKLITTISSILSLIGSILVGFIAIRGISKQKDKIKAPKSQTSILGWFLIIIGFIGNLITNFL